MASSVTACPTCVFGATSTSLLSFTFQAVETITVSVIPHVTVFPNGTDTTSFERKTLTETDYVGGGNGGTTTSRRTFTDKKEFEWTVGDATLTYPTTYIQYLGFQGAPATTTGAETCANPSDASPVSLPASTETASFIYPLGVNATADAALPVPLLSYLGQIPEVASQFDGEVLTGCAPLTYTPRPIYTTLSVEPTFPTFSFDTGSASSSAAGSSSSGVYYGNSSVSSLNPITTKIRPEVPSSSEATPTRLPTQSYNAPEESSSAEYSAPAYSTQPAESEVTTTMVQETITHSTAFFITAITGPTTYTTMTPRGQADHSMFPFTFSNYSSQC
jgi:hypothetical protein